MVAVSLRIIIDTSLVCCRLLAAERLLLRRVPRALEGGASTSSKSVVGTSSGDEGLTKVP